MRYIASVSFGKDSLAMLLRLIEERKPIDEVIFYDTGMEFGAIYNLRDKIKDLLTENQIKYTELKPTCPFLYKMFDITRVRGERKGEKGYQWCGGKCRWGTTDKLSVLDNYCKQSNSYCYVGIAFDETKRLKKERSPYKIFPLAEWKMTESNCLKYCYEHGFNWEEPDILTLKNGEWVKVDLYDILDRVSCWCCRDKNLKELKNYFLYLPNYWSKLKALQDRMSLPFYRGKTKKFPNGRTIYDLEKQFKEEIKNGKKED